MPATFDRDDRLAAALPESTSSRTASDDDDVPGLSPRIGHNHRQAVAVRYRAHPIRWLDNLEWNRLATAKFRPVVSATCSSWRGRHSSNQRLPRARQIVFRQLPEHFEQRRAPAIARVEVSEFSRLESGPSRLSSPSAASDILRPPRRDRTAPVRCSSAQSRHRTAAVGCPRRHFALSASSVRGNRRHFAGAATLATTSSSSSRRSRERMAFASWCCAEPVSDYSQGAVQTTPRAGPDMATPLN